MKKENKLWTIKDLQDKYKTIEFPEFQREPTVWGLEKKRLLIDSIFRGFDIATIYLYRSNNDENESENEQYECIDGRQRINAILSYLGLNETEDSEEAKNQFDNKFRFRSTNEISSDKLLQEMDGRTFAELKSDENSNTDSQFLSYSFNVLEISNVADNEELNLMFLRLQLGSNLNPGEKLRAMKGAMRDIIFGSEAQGAGIGKHAFFGYLSIPERRYAREQVAVQVAMNFFSRKKDSQFHRARFLDLQEFLGKYVELDEDDKALAEELKSKLDRVYAELSKVAALRLKNRAIGVSTFFFINQLIDDKKEAQILEFIKFLQMFLPTLREQVEKGIDIDSHFRDLLKFQTYISQAAVEKYAIENRQIFLEEYFKYFQKTGQIKKIENLPQADQPAVIAEPIP